MTNQCLDFVLHSYSILVMHIVMVSFTSKHLADDNRSIDKIRMVSSNTGLNKYLVLFPQLLSTFKV